MLPRFTGEDTRSTAALIPNCKLKIYEGAPHGLMYTHMERVKAEIMAFIEER